MRENIFSMYVEGSGFEFGTPIWQLPDTFDLMTFPEPASDLSIRSTGRTS